MKVAARLRGAFAIYIALLAALVAYNVRTIRRSVNSGRVLTEISSRLRVSSTAQVARLTQMNGDAEKYLVTNDAGYLDRFRETSRAFGESLAPLDSVALAPQERAALTSLSAHWKTVIERSAALAAVTAEPTDEGQRTVSRLQAAVDLVQEETRALAAASQDAMTSELANAEDSARTAEHLAWIAAIAALLLSGLLSALLVRSIVGPLGRLAHGTREVSAGRFDYRLDASGDDEFAQVARDFNSMTERLDELDRMKRDFVTKVSHDLKTPLSSMQETISALLDELTGPVPPAQRKLLELNLESGRRLSAMLGKLLDLSRIEAGLEPDFQLLDAAQLVKRSMERVGAVPSAREFRLAFVEPAHRLIVRGDASGLGQVLDNLLENAIKFSPPGGTVTVRLAEWPSGGDPVPPEYASKVHVRGLQGGAVLLTVADQGPGVPVDERERIFSRFYQTDAGRAARGRGVGLGLTICREIVTAHRGSMWVADVQPRGSRFCVLLPGAVGTPDVARSPALAAGDRFGE